MSQNHDETHCKSCGRYIGACEVCHFCRAFNPKRTVVRVIKYLSPVVAVLGLFVLQMIGTRYGNPEVKLDSLSKRSNFAQITVKAEVSSTPRYYPAVGKGDENAGSMDFEIDDGTALMPVKCYDDATRELRDAKKVPSLGDRVKLRGSFQYKGKGGSLILGSEMGMELDRPAPAGATPIKDLPAGGPEKFRRGERVRITGKVTDVKDASYELSLRLGDMASSEVSAVVPLSILQLYKHAAAETGDWTPAKGCPAEGDVVTVTGAVDWRGKKGSQYPVIVVATVEEIVKADETKLRSDNKM